MAHHNISADERGEDKGPGARVCPALDCNRPDLAADKAVKKVFGILGVDVDKFNDLFHHRVLDFIAGRQ